jgi:SAM-dependent methyltransferase
VLASQERVSLYDQPVTTREKIKQLIPPQLEPPVRAILAWYRRVLLRRYRLALGPVRGRDRALAAEVAFWKSWFDRSDVNVDERLDPVLTDPVVVGCLARIPREDVSIIDVGAGPLTTLGTQFPGKRVWLTAVDPLADQYARILRERSITPPVVTERCSGEELLARFEPECFDIAFSENALDHSVDPLPIIENMVRLVKVGGFVVLRHNLNQADSVDYATLHQWNFEEQEGRCIIWREGTHLDLGRALSGKGTLVECRTEQGSDGVRHVVCVFEKCCFTGLSREARSQGN